MHMIDTDFYGRSSFQEIVRTYFIKYCVVFSQEILVRTLLNILREEVHHVR